MEKEKYQKKAEVIMKKRNNYFKLGYWIFVCAVLLTGCSKERSTEERIVVEDVKEEMEEEKAFRTSCVWYYRQLIDDIGQDRMQEELEKLQYGNCDISDWEGRLNTNNNNRALTGFWIESSLLISPKEQTEVMERIFGENSEYSEETQSDLKQVMLVTEQERTDILIYGKTGMGKADGIVVDAWFTGFAETAEGNLYFCVRLGRTDGMNVSSPLAKEIAIQIVSDYSN